jgi:hypothetical protein
MGCVISQRPFGCAWDLFAGTSVFDAVARGGSQGMDALDTKTGGLLGKMARPRAAHPIPQADRAPARAEGPLHLNSSEEPLWHVARAEGLSIPVLNPCGTHRGARVQLWDKRGGQRQSDGSLYWHTNPRPRPRTLGLAAEGTRISTSHQGGRRERRWRRDADKTCPLLLLGFGKM